MTKLGNEVPSSVQDIRSHVARILSDHSITLVDAESVTTGRDFLAKIWNLLLSVPIGIAITYKRMPARTLGNVFYEFGLMQALGKETLLITDSPRSLPSDLVRTEYIKYDGRFEARFRAFINDLGNRVTYLDELAEAVERNPLLAIDCYRRAFLISGDEGYCAKARRVLDEVELGDRARNSVEMLIADFCEQYAQEAAAAAE